MKKIILVFSAAVILLIAFSSCKKIIAALFKGVDVNVPQVEVTIPSIIAVVPVEISLGTFSYHFNLDSNVKAKTGGVFGANAVNSIKIKQINVSFSNADQLNNFSNFEIARVTLHSNSNNNPVTIFTTNFPDTYAASVSIAPNDVELLSYLKGSEIIYTIFGKMRRITTKPLNMSISIIVRAN